MAAENIAGDKLQAEGLLRGYNLIGCDVLNIGGYDLAAGMEFLKSLSEKSKITFISANLVDENNRPYFNGYKIIEKNGIKIGVVGITNHVPDHVKNVKALPYVDAAKQVIDKLKSQVKYVVLLANLNSNDSKNLTNEFPEVDYIFLSRDTQRTRQEQGQNEQGPFVYSSGDQGKFLTMVKIDIKNHKKPLINITEANSRVSSLKSRLNRLQEKEPQKKLEEIYSDQPNVLSLITDYRQQLLKYETILKEAVNTTNFESIPMDKNIGEDPEILKFVDETLASCNALRKKPIKADGLLTPTSGQVTKKTLDINK